MEDAVEIFCYRLTYPPLSNDSFHLSLLQVQYSTAYLTKLTEVGRWLEQKKTIAKNIWFRIRGGQKKEKKQRNSKNIARKTMNKTKKNQECLGHCYACRTQCTLSAHRMHNVIN
jgi:hypothetical protein